jgi:hypothetical protein
MAGPQHGIMGESFGIDLPETQVSSTELMEEKRLAKFSKSREFQTLKERMQLRIDFYKTQLPDGRPLTGVDATERATQWVIANCVIAEFNAVIEAYEQASVAVTEAGKKNASQ